jgi:poly(3-hydroxybutyrate) depolymerase
MKAFRYSFDSTATCITLLMMLSLPACAQDSTGPGHRLQTLREMMANKRANDALKVSEEYLGAQSQNVAQDSFNDRDMILYLPSHLPPKGQRGMVVALHGGGGNAQNLQDHLKMDGVAEKYGFIVAYLNGTDASAKLPGKMKAWNAGNGCCGEPYKDKVDDVSYITSAVRYLVQKYGVNPEHIYGIGHSNGAMMTQTVMCETGLYQAAISLAGGLMAEVDHCAGARGKTILAMHGTLDANVPPVGGKGSKGVTTIDYKSEADSKSMFERSGGQYTILWLKGTDHSLEHIAETIQKNEGISLAEKTARFFGLAQ